MKKNTVFKTTSRIRWQEKLGHIMVRLGIKRYSYKIGPGLYSTGSPDADSLVFVTANYKLSFDILRESLGVLNAWILVLDTNGINVWCAAGKGSFGTEELVSRIKSTGLEKRINHRKLILPQLGATGVAAHRVRKETGFRVLYGPVYARDIQEYLQNGMKKTPSMMRVTFNMAERLMVAPLEFFHAALNGLFILAVLIILGIIARQGSLYGINTALVHFLPFLTGIIAGTLIFPAVLPLLPGKPFALKGALLAIICSLFFLFVYPVFKVFTDSLIIIPITSFLALNFTGSTSFTSLSGVKTEVKWATPFILILFLCGIIFIILSLWSIL